MFKSNFLLKIYPKASRKLKFTLIYSDDHGARGFVTSSDHCALYWFKKNSPFQAEDSVDDDVLNSFCWMYSSFDMPPTFTGPCNRKKYVGTHLYNTYYQWIPIFLAFIAALLYIPRCIWLMIEGGLMAYIVKGILYDFLKFFKIALDFCPRFPLLWISLLQIAYDHARLCDFFRNSILRGFSGFVALEDLLNLKERYLQGPFYVMTFKLLLAKKNIILYFYFSLQNIHVLSIDLNAI